MSFQAIAKLEHKQDSRFSNIDVIRQSLEGAFLNEKMVVLKASTSTVERGLMCRALRLERWCLESGQIVHHKYQHLLTTLSQIGCATFIHLSSDGNNILIDIGVRQTDLMPDNAVSLAEKTLEGCMNGLFPGAKTDKIIPTDMAWLDELYNEVRFPMKDGGWSLGLATTIPDKVPESAEALHSPIEHLVEALRGRKWECLILADPIQTQYLDEAQKGLEELWTSLSPLAKSQHTITEQETQSYSSSIGSNLSTAISEGLSRSLSYSKGSSDSLGSSVTATTGVTVGVSSGFLPGPNSSVSQSVSLGINYGHTWNETKTEGETESTNKTNTKGTSETFTDGKSIGTSQGQSIEFQNKTVLEIMLLIEDHLERIKAAKANGAWMASTYLWGDANTVKIGCGIWQGCLRGEGTHVEKTKYHIWHANSDERNAAMDWLRKLQHPVVAIEANGLRTVKNLSALLTTDELASTSHLPSQSVPGLPVIEEVSFAREPISLSLPAKKGRFVQLGTVHHLHRDEINKILLDISKFTEHILITGTTGVGKSTALRSLIHQLHDHGIKWCVVEPAKSEYNILSQLSSEEMPVICFDFSPKGKIPRWNPLSFPNGISLADHVDRFCAVLNAAFPMYASMPQLLEKAVYMAYEENGWNLLTSTCTNRNKQFPTFVDVVGCVKHVLEQANYSGETRSNFEAALGARLESLCRGPLGLAFNSPESDSLSPEVLWETCCVINLSNLGSTEKKAVVMGFLLVALQEWRQIMGTSDSLRHLMVFEEAHNLLRSSEVKSGDMGNAQSQSIEFFANAIAEMRSYGQGFCVVDQSVSSLDPSVIKNTNTRISFRAPDAADRAVLGGSLSLNEEQNAYLARMANHIAVIKQSDWLEPVLCKIKPFVSESVQYSHIAAPLSPDRAIAGILFQGRGLRAEMWPESLPTNLPPAIEKQITSLYLSKPGENLELTAIAPVIMKWRWAQLAVSNARTSSSSDRGAWNALVALAQRDFKLGLHDAENIAHALVRSFKELDGLNHVWERLLL